MPKSNGHKQQEKNFGGRPAWRGSETPLDVHFVKVINNLQRRFQWSQGDLAHALEKATGKRTTVQTAHDIVNGNTQPTLSKVWELSLAYDVPISTFFAEEDWMPPLDERLAVVWGALTDEQKEAVYALVKFYADANGASRGEAEQVPVAA